MILALELLPIFLARNQFRKRFIYNNLVFFIRFFEDTILPKVSFAITFRDSVLILLDDRSFAAWPSLNIEIGCMLNFCLGSPGQTDFSNQY